MKGDEGERLLQTKEITSYERIQQKKQKQRAEGNDTYKRCMTRKEEHKLRKAMWTTDKLDDCNVIMEMYK